METTLWREQPFVSYQHYRQMLLTYAIHNDLRRAWWCNNSLIRGQTYWKHTRKQGIIAVETFLQEEVKSQSSTTHTRTSCNRANHLFYIHGTLRPYQLFLTEFNEANKLQTAHEAKVCYMITGDGRAQQTRLRSMSRPSSGSTGRSHIMDNSSQHCCDVTTCWTLPASQHWGEEPRSRWRRLHSSFPPLWSLSYQTNRLLSQLQVLGATII
jgi:hypothetical protein